MFLSVILPELISVAVGSHIDPDAVCAYGARPNAVPTWRRRDILWSADKIAIRIDVIQTLVCAWIDRDNRIRCLDRSRHQTATQRDQDGPVEAPQLVLPNSHPQTPSLKQVDSIAGSRFRSHVVATSDWRRSTEAAGSDRQKVENRPNG
ncbi:MAG: hypothetical protein H6993_03470 [Pseudomonadales bacterium]|nr:hypothetical protein [Pseudomonadales bacterium]MCP5182993.1 hypothetical protein [Pseudomonadales bacterium]